jgi:hypothetical protein
MEKLQKGASYPAVTDSEVKGIYISFPKSLKEQQTIVQKLNALSATLLLLDGSGQTGQTGQSYVRRHYATTDRCNSFDRTTKDLIVPQ